MMKAKPVKVDSADTTSVDVDVVRRVKAVTTEDWALALLAVVLASKVGHPAVPVLLVWVEKDARKQREMCLRAF
jgi:hypothetical protein